MMVRLMTNMRQSAYKSYTVVGEMILDHNITKLVATHHLTSITEMFVECLRNINTQKQCLLLFTSLKRVDSVK